MTLSTNLVAVLHIQSGDLAGLRRELHVAPCRLGRAAHNDVVIPDFHLSSEHGEFFLDDGVLCYRDLQSTNGSVHRRVGASHPVDARCAWQVTLAHGDVLALGAAERPVLVRVGLATEGHDDDELAPLVASAPELSNSGSAQLLATRSIIDLPSVTAHIATQPKGALALYQIAARLQARLDVAAVLTACGDSLFELLPGATHVAILLRADDDQARFVLASSRQAPGRMHATEVEEPMPVRASRAVLRRVLATRAAILSANAQEELAASQSIMSSRVLSMLAVPLWRNEEIIGLIQIDNRHSAGIFTEAELEQALLFASLAALAIDNAQLYNRIKAAEETARGENAYLRRKQAPVRFTNIIGKAPALQAVFAQLEKVVDTRATVCIEGETGTGKELIASAIHHQSNRQAQMFVAQNCATLPENLLESELFGHRRGAFTGADADKKGLFEIADGGTLFLDEVGEMPMALQAKLLRALQEGTIRPVGGTVEKRVDVRIVCATNRDLAAEVAAGTFRQDLYYRLVVFPIRLPPLRERATDIPALANHFLMRYASEYGMRVPGLTQQALDALMAYAWPGNIRELENELQRLVISAEPEHWLDVADLSPRLRQTTPVPHVHVQSSGGTLKDMMDEVERSLILNALREHGNNKTKTAVALGITREGLHKKLTKLGL